MAPSSERLRALHAAVGAFRIRDRKLEREQAAIGAVLAAGDVPDADARRYLDAVSQYFSSFTEEAQGHLADVDKRLANAQQVVFNLTAERGVALRRIEATQAILTALGELR